MNAALEMRSLEPAAKGDVALLPRKGLKNPLLIGWEECSEKLGSGGLGFMVERYNLLNP